MKERRIFPSKNENEIKVKQYCIIKNKKSHEIWLVPVLFYYYMCEISMFFIWGGNVIKHTTDETLVYDCLLQTNEFPMNYL